MIDAIFSIFGGASSDFIVLIVLAGLVGLFALGSVGRISQQAVPALMTSLGIFGTFWGIFIALYPLDFSAEKINASIEALLKGMTAAFVTSLLGILAAIVSRIWWSLSLKKGPLVSPEHQDLADRLDAIKQAISGDDASSMVTQMQKLRDENRDGFQKLDGLADTIRDALVENLKKLMDDLREIIGKQLGEQLQKLIDNIQEALINQFGKTFVEFNKAVQALKQWQADHRVQVEQLTAAFAQTALGIEKIRGDCESIPPTMEKLRVILKAANAQIEDLTARLSAFADMKRQAEESFPAIKANLDKIGSDLAESAEGLKGMKETILDTFATAETATKRIAEQHATNVNGIATKMRETMENAQNETAAKVRTSFEKFTVEFDDAITRVTKEWGENLVSIAEKCAETIRKVEERRGE